MELYEITNFKKPVGGIETEYYLFKMCSESYQIIIRRENSEEKAEFKGDLFTMVALFKTIIDTDTLPENLSEIEDDVKNSFCV